MSYNLNEALKKQAAFDKTAREIREGDLAMKGRQKDEMTMVDRHEMVVMSDEEFESLKAAAPSKQQNGERKKINIEVLNEQVPKKEKRVGSANKDSAKKDNAKAAGEQKEDILINNNVLKNKK